MASIERANIRLRNVWNFSKLLSEPGHGCFPRAAIKPIDKTQCPKILTPKSLFRSNFEIFYCLKREFRYINLYDPILSERVVFQWVRRTASFLIIPLIKRTRVENHQTAVFEIAKVYLKRSRV